MPVVLAVVWALSGCASEAADEDEGTGTPATEAVDDDSGAGTPATEAVDDDSGAGTPAAEAVDDDSGAGTPAAEGGEPMCGAIEPSPLCEARAADGPRRNLSLCTTAYEARPVSGAVVGRGMGAAPCFNVFDEADCVSSYLDVFTDAGEIVGFGFCTPTGFRPPLIGTRVLVTGDAVGWDLCDQRSLEIRDEGGEVLFVGLQEDPGLEVGPLGVERRLVCHTLGGEYIERYSLELALGGESVIMESGHGRLGTYMIDLLGSSRVHLCGGGWDCNASGILDSTTLAIQRDPEGCEGHAGACCEVSGFSYDTDQACLQGDDQGASRVVAHYAAPEGSECGGSAVSTCFERVVDGERQVIYAGSAYDEPAALERSTGFVPCDGALAAEVDAAAACAG